MIIGINPQTTQQIESVLAANYASGNEITLLIDSLTTITQQEYKKLTQLAIGNVEEFHPISNRNDGYEVKLRQGMTQFVYLLDNFASTDAMSVWIWSYNVRTMYHFVKDPKYTKSKWNAYIDDLEAEMDSDPYRIREEIVHEFIWKNKIDYAEMKQIIINDWPSFVGDWDLLVKFSINKRIYIVVR